MTHPHFNAPCVPADRYGNILDNPPLAEAIATDPLLADVKLVAWPGDTTLLPRQGQRGFPHWGRWSERNLHSTTDLQHALGDPSNAGSSASGSTRASALATRSAQACAHSLAIPLPPAAELQRGATCTHAHSLCTLFILRAKQYAQHKMP